MAKPICKLCHQSDDFADAHIVPRAFYPHRGREKDGMKILSNNRPPSKSRIGVYDTALVCNGCEALFDPFDNYAVKLLLDGAERLEPQYDQGVRLGLGSPSFDYTLLKLFALSMLWRAASSDRVEFENVAIGPFLPVLAKMVASRDSGDPEMFATILTRFVDPEMRDSGILSPYRERLVGVTFYRFVVGAYVIHIKVDRQRVPNALSPLVIRPGAPLFILEREFRDSAEHRVFLRVVQESHARRLSRH